ncbi:hypothetical protein ACTPEO_07540 [Clostridioides difficile]
MDYITTKEAVKNWEVAYRMVMYHYSAGRIKLAKKKEILALFLLTDNSRSRDVKDGENK